MKQLKAMYAGNPEDNNFVRVVHVVTTVMSQIAGLGIVMLMLIALADIGFRKFLGPGIAGAYEVTEISLACVAFAGMAAAEATKTHVRTPLLVERLPYRAADVARAIGLTVVILALCWITYLTLKSGIRSYQEGEYRFGLNQVPIWPAKLFIPMGLFALILEFLIDDVRAVARVVRNGPYPERRLTLAESVAANLGDDVGGSV
jgi:TRAP-type C4-dicarboxylate transport system permease small subunit